tara:strand:+ start:4526 stop:4972 length:447 start_codon:yes stop_codon:yes gene_type:complete
MSEFKQQLKDNDGSHEIEVDSLTIDNETCSLYYFKDADAIQIIFWDEHHGDEQKFITTHKFGSFKEYAENNDYLIVSTEQWDAQTESVFQKYDSIEFDEWIYEDKAEDCLVDFMNDSLLIHGTQYVKRSLCDRVSRWVNLKMYNLKNL